MSGVDVIQLSSLLVVRDLPDIKSGKGATVDNYLVFTEPDLKDTVFRSYFNVFIFQIKHGHNYRVLD